MGSDKVRMNTGTHSELLTSSQRELDVREEEPSFFSVLSNLLSLTAPGEWQDICLYSGDKIRIKVNSSGEMLIFSLNIILLLEGKRLAYRTSSFGLSLLPKLSELTGDRLAIVPLIPEEPLIFLRENLPRVMSIFSSCKTNKDVDAAYGTLLDYPHIGSGTRDCMIVSYCVGDALALYSFQVPNSQYTREVRDKIRYDLEKYQQVLSRYGYEVKLFVFQNERPREMGDTLPEL